MVSNTAGTVADILAQVWDSPDNVTYNKWVSRKRASCDGLQRLHTADNVAVRWLEGTAMKALENRWTDILDEFRGAADVVEDAGFEPVGSTEHGHQITFQVEREQLA